MEKLKSKDNVIQFNNDMKLLQELAEEKESNGDIEGALALYLEIENSNKFGAVLYRDIADIYTRLAMFEESIDYWYKYLNCVTKRHYAEAYNGLGGNFYLLGYPELAAYYFNLQINDKSDCDLPFDDYMYELFYGTSELTPDLNLRLVDTEGDEDEKKIEEAKVIFAKEPKKAYSMVESVKDDSSRHDDAVITLAAFDVVKGDYESAAERYKTTLKSEEWGEYCYNNLFGCLFVMEKNAEADAIFNYIKKTDISDYDQLAKFFHLLKTEEKYEIAYNYAAYMRKLFDDPYMSLMSGFAAYNYKKYDEARDSFLRFYKTTKSVYANYYVQLCERAANGDKTADKTLEFDFTLPESAIKSLEKDAEYLISLSGNKLRKNKEKVYEFCDKCFSLYNVTLQGVACQLLSILNSARSEKYLKNILLNRRIDNKIKSLVMTLLVIMGNDKLTGVVYSNIYYRMEFPKIEFNGQCGDVFLNAYALAFGKIAILNMDNVFKIKMAAEDIYYKLESNGNLHKINEVVSLAATIAIFSFSDINKTKNEIIEFMGADSKEVDKIISLINKE